MLQVATFDLVHVTFLFKIIASLITNYKFEISNNSVAQFIFYESIEVGAVY